MAENDHVPDRISDDAADRGWKFCGLGHQLLARPAGYSDAPRDILLLAPASVRSLENSFRPPQVPIGFHPQVVLVAELMRINTAH